MARDVLSRRCIECGKWPPNKCRRHNPSVLVYPKNSFWHSDQSRQQLYHRRVAFLRNLRDRQKGQFNAYFVLHHCSHAEEDDYGGGSVGALKVHRYVVIPMWIIYIIHIRLTNQWPLIPSPQIIYQQISWEQRQTPSEDDRSKYTRMDLNSSSSCPEGTNLSPANSTVSCHVPRRRFNFLPLLKRCEYGINHLHD